jgi:hypothetical protein
VQYLSLDPYMRGRMDNRESYAAPTPLGNCLIRGENVKLTDASGWVILRIPRFGVTFRGRFSIG